MIPAGSIAGFAVHVFTALGAVCGLLALHFAADHQWATAFAWLGVAALIDGVDGPIARRLDVARRLPRFSGVWLDLVVDYLNYCVVPAFVLLQSQRAGESFSLFAACAMVLSALFHFSDTRSKTADGYFVGFPGIWNVVVFYFFVFETTAVVTISVTFALTVLTFMPLKWIHPLRVSSFKNLTYLVMAAWSLAAAYEVFAGLPGDFVSRAILLITAGYLVLISMYRSFGQAGPGPGHSQ